MQINYVYTIQIRVRYSETDQMGYCYYGNYAHYFEVGRVETMRSLGSSYKILEENGILLPVREYHVRYHAPAMYDDLLHVQTTVTEIKGAKIAFTYKILNEHNQLICEASTDLVFINKNTRKPTQAPLSFVQLFQKHASHD